MKNFVNKGKSRLILAALMLLLVLAGCAKKEASGATNDSGLAEVTLHFIFFDGKKSATDEVWNAIFEKFKSQLNAKFDVQFIAGTDYVDKILVKQSAGDSWDLNYDGGWLSYYQMVNLNGYMDLNDLLPRHAPDLYKAYQDSGILNAVRSKGKITALPWTNVINRRPFFDWRGDLIDIDPSTIKTVEDVEKVMYQLQKMYPGKYIIEQAAIRIFQTKHELIPISNNFAFSARDPNYTVVHMAETEAYRERGRYGYKWQKDGLIWADVLIDQLDHNQLMNQGQLLAQWGNHELATSSRAWVEPNAHWDYNSLYEDKMFANDSPTGNIVAIPRTSKNPERTLMWLNLLETSQEMYDMVHYGIEGKTYVMDGEFVGFPQGMNAANSNYQLYQGRWALFRSQFMRPDSEYAKGFWQNEKDFAGSNPNNIVSPFSGFVFDTEPVTSEMAQMQQIFDAVEKMLNVGLAGEPDAVIDKMLADLNRAGLQKVKAEMQRQINAYLAGN
jgi:putative aldouronate transport system substrate-binding protein